MDFYTLILIVVVLLMTGAIYVYGLWNKCKEMRVDQYSQYSDDNLSDLQRMLFRVYTSSVIDGNPRGWAIEYSEFLINDLKRPEPIKWRKVIDLPELQSGSENDDFRSLIYTAKSVLIVVDDDFRIVNRDQIEDGETLCVPFMEIIKDI